ncbi:uncharacterized protein LOC122257128 [Penaeus japonicus]|uniref:uncharacterized protein LOC122257128 n=1 Tax=Penaeus japonicus TaxID=27405 RepID=UPI001C70B962|nr:uncharacterized protein LOC122257128 [Penaeus japonicus]
MVERFHRQLKTALRSAPTHNWMDELPLMLLGTRSALKEDPQCTAAELLKCTNSGLKQSVQQDQDLPTFQATPRIAHTFSSASDPSFLPHSRPMTVPSQSSGVARKPRRYEEAPVKKLSPLILPSPPPSHPRGRAAPAEDQIAALSASTNRDESLEGAHPPTIYQALSAESDGTQQDADLLL